MNPPRPSGGRVRALLGVAALACTIGACGVPEHSEVRQLERVPFGLDVTTTTTSTTSTTVVATTLAPPREWTTVVAVPSTLATESVSLFFVTVDQLNEVRIPLASPTSLAQVLAALVVGPPVGQAGTGLRTALTPLPTLFVRDDGAGVANIDLPETFFDSIPTTDHRLAIGQLVLTMTARPGIGQVRFTRGGRAVEVPSGTGALAPAGRLLTRRDFLVLLNPSAAPSAARTSTSAPRASTTVHQQSATNSATTALRSATTQRTTP